MPPFRYDKLVVPVWLIAIAISLFLALLGTTYFTGKQISWSPFGFVTSTEKRVGEATQKRTVKVDPSDWFMLKEGQAKSLSHNLGKVPDGFTIYIQNEDGSSDLVDLVSYQTVGGVGAMITEITDKTYVVRGGRHNIRDRFPGTTGPDRLATLNEGMFRVVPWAVLNILYE